jgi:hypothetical protein
MTGANIARSIVSCWILCSSASRFAIALGRLLLEQLVDVGISAVGVGALGLDEDLDAAGGVAGVSGRGHEQAAQLLLLPGGVERAARSIERKPDADAGCVQVVHHGLGHGRKAGDRGKFPGIDPLWIAGSASSCFALRRS